MFSSISVFHMAGIICQVSLHHWIKDECQLNFFFSKMLFEEPEIKESILGWIGLIWGEPSHARTKDGYVVSSGLESPDGVYVQKLGKENTKSDS